MQRGPHVPNAMRHGMQEEKAISFNCPDVINGAFEALGAAMTAVNIVRLLRDKQVRGFVPHLGWFYTAWACYNLYFYPHLKQWASFSGGCCILIANAAYTLLALSYVKNQRRVQA